MKLYNRSVHTMAKRRLAKNTLPPSLSLTVIIRGNVKPSQLLELREILMITDGLFHYCGERRAANALSLGRRSFNGNCSGILGKFMRERERDLYSNTQRKVADDHILAIRIIIILCATQTCVCVSRRALTSLNILLFCISRIQLDASAFG